MISIRGNRRICSIEKALENLLPEKLSRTKLLEKAIDSAVDHPDIDWLALSEKMSHLPDDNISVPSFMQAQLSEEAEDHFQEIQNDIFQAVKTANPDARYVQEKYVWQLCLMALLEELRSEAALKAEADRTNYDKLDSARLFLELMASTNEEDQYLISRMIEDLNTWARTRN